MGGPSMTDTLRSAMIPDQAILHKLLSYDPVTGVLTWRLREPDDFEDGGFGKAHKANTWNGRFAGKLALNCLNGRGYLQGKLLGKTVTAHRVIWKYVTGVDADIIDHINGIRTFNGFINLRSVEESENFKNQKIHVTNTSGHTGVSYSKRDQKWSAYIGNEGKPVQLGHFETIGEAVEARRRANEVYQYHENHGRISGDENKPMVSSAERFDVRQNLSSAHALAMADEGGE